MITDTARFAVSQVADRIGLGIAARVRTSAEGPAFEFSPVDAHPNESFAVQFNIHWRSAEAILVPGRFAGALIQQMGRCSPEGKDVFTSFAKALESRRVRIQMRVNGADVSPVLTESWPNAWNRLELTLRTQPMVIEPEDVALHERLVIDLVVPFFGMMAALIGVEDNEPATTGETEGRAFQILATKYERRKVNREACIQLKGSRCIVCGFDFSETYGPLGIGFIEIHHTTPIAAQGGEYHINVGSDLEPLCSNCHAMAHREEPPVPIERLKELVRQRRKAADGMK